MRPSIAAAFALLACGFAGAAGNPMSYSEFTRIMGSFQESRLLLTAVELDIFTAVGDGASAAQVAAKLKTNPRATETFLNALAAVGALSKQEGVFRNTPDIARRLVSGSPEYARPALMHTVHMWTGWSALTESIRAGTAAAPPGVEAQDPQWTGAFIAAMHRNAATNAAALVRDVGVTGVRRMIDIGGGSGAYSIAFAQAKPDLRAEVLDLAAVAPIAQKHIDEAGLSSRVTTRVGDLTKDDFGRDYDLALLSAICHMLSPEENQDLFRRCHRALAPGGRLVIRDFILEPGKTAPRPAAMFAVHMLVNTRGGSTYSEQEYRSWLESAGFVKIARPASPGDLIVAIR
ncbi:MAG: methyltransferase domain-containing protein [Bryobacteraceae bacterium]|nr:methyltransferase domain-containing protein [Bryobacteraceae bacterium]